MVKQLTLASVLLLSLCSCSSNPLVTNINAQQPTKKSSIDTVAVAITNVPSRSTQQKPLVVEFYSTICAACKEIQPTIDKIVADYKGRVDFKVYDAAGIPDDVKRRYQFIGYPQLVILNADGEIAFNRMGFQTYESLSSDLNAVLKSSNTSTDESSKSVITTQ